MSTRTLRLLPASNESTLFLSESAITSLMMEKIKEHPVIQGLFPYGFTYQRVTQLGRGDGIQLCGRSSILDVKKGGGR